MPRKPKTVEPVTPPELPDFDDTDTQEIPVIELPVTDAPRKTVERPAVAPVARIIRLGEAVTYATETKDGAEVAAETVYREIRLPGTKRVGMIQHVRAGQPTH